MSIQPGGAIIVPRQHRTLARRQQDAVVGALLGRRRQVAHALAHLAQHPEPLAEAAHRLVVALRDGHKVLVAGNGGSAAEAQHFAAELVGRFKRERAPYAALALTADSAVLTAIANDFGYREVFARQVRALGEAGDLFVAFSTSGESDNVVRAAAAARERLVAVVAVTGPRPSRLARLADVAVHVPVAETAAMQELHMAVTHILCDVAEAELATGAERGTR